MKRQDILEIIVNNPKAIFANSNWESGKYSEYPQCFQVVGMSNDKSYVRVKQVIVRTEAFVLESDGTQYAKGENGKWIADTRPINERTVISYGEIRSIPTRLVLKTDKTEESLIADCIAKVERLEQERVEREAEHERSQKKQQELTELLSAVGIINNEDDVRLYRGHGEIRVSSAEAIDRLISALKSALVEVGA